MKSIRTVLNVLSLAVICGGGFALVPSASAQSEKDGSSGGSCCNAADTRCYLNLDGVIIREEEARSC